MENAPINSPAFPDEPAPATPRADLMDAAGWLALGAAVLAGSITMDRLEDQDVNPYTVPGLLPGLLGIAMLLLGSVLMVRSLRKGALASRPAGMRRHAHGRAMLVIGLCVIFGTVLVGHGLPFWVAAALFVTVTILVLQQSPAGTVRRPVTAMGAAKAALIGLCAGGAITLVFQQIFLVRLP
jgi:hypothetical protein